MKWKKFIPYILTLIFILLISLNADAQCAMCKTSAEKSAYAKSLNRGIEYLLLAPVVILGTVLVIWMKNRDKFAGKS